MRFMVIPTNRSARTCVMNRKAFRNKGGTVFGGHWGGLYVAYSYGLHWPMLIYDEQSQTWFENSGRYSVTTSKHQSLTHPHCHTELRDVDWMRECIKCGGEGFLEERRLMASLPLC